jgi:hypothetical protein
MDTLSDIEKGIIFEHRKEKGVQHLNKIIFDGVRENIRKEKKELIERITKNYEECEEKNKKYTYSYERSFYNAYQECREASNGSNTRLCTELIYKVTNKSPPLFFSFYNTNGF